MRILALETNQRKIYSRYLSTGERVLMRTHYHSLSYLLAILREMVMTIAFIIVGVVLWFLEVPLFWPIVAMIVTWMFFAFFNLLKAYIDWWYDCIVITNYKLILIDQTSLFKQSVKPIQLENIGSVRTDTQFWNLFGFGRITLDLKEGEGGEAIHLDYVPRMKIVAAQISDSVTRYQTDN